MSILISEQMLVVFLFVGLLRNSYLPIQCIQHKTTRNQRILWYHVWSWWRNVLYTPSNCNWLLKCLGNMQQGCHWQSWSHLSQKSHFRSIPIDPTIQLTGKTYRTPWNLTMSWFWPHNVWHCGGKYIVGKTHCQFKKQQSTMFWPNQCALLFWKSAPSIILLLSSVMVRMQHYFPNWTSFLIFCVKHSTCLYSWLRWHWYLQ